MRTRRASHAALAAAGALVALVAYVAGVHASPLPAVSAAPVAAADPSETTAEINDLLGQVRTVPQRPHVPGYSRGCSSGYGCVFGAPWTDASQGQGAGNGCDTRDDVMAAQMTSVTYAAGDTCTLASGTLADPYTGQTISWSKSNATAVQIDHVYPLAYAWDMGAYAWPVEERVRFANDEALNLLAVDGPANSAKGDSGPAEWLPANASYRCTYVERFLQVAAAYSLPITTADAASIRSVAAGCS